MSFRLYVCPFPSNLVSQFQGYQVEMCLHGFQEGMFSIQEKCSGTFLAVCHFSCMIWPELQGYINFSMLKLPSFLVTFRCKNYSKGNI